LGGRNPKHRRCAGLQESAVDEAGVLQCDGTEFVRKRKNDVEILNRQQFCRALVEPTGATGSLTLGAVTIAARIVGDTPATTVVARFDVSTQLRRTTAHEITKHTVLLDRKCVSVRFQVGRPIRAQNVCHF
jgi:hypothetical protein